MPVFNNELLKHLRNPKLLVEIAQATHKRALELIVTNVVPNHYLNAEIYEPGVRKIAPSGDSYYEISRHSDGFGASLFIKRDSMLLVFSNHEVASEVAMANDRQAYIEPLIAGISEEWQFVLDILIENPAFEFNPPVAIFWFADDQWHITDNREALQINNDYKSGFDKIDTTDLCVLFAHGDCHEVNHELIEEHFEEWKN